MCQIVCVSVCAGKIAPSHFVIALLLAGRFRNPVTMVHHESSSTSLRASRSRKEVHENSDNIQTIFRQYSDLSREFSDNIQAIFRILKIQAIFRQYSGNIQAIFRPRSWSNFAKFSHLFLGLRSQDSDGRSPCFQCWVCGFHYKYASCFYSPWLLLLLLYLQKV